MPSDSPPLPAEGAELLDSEHEGFATFARNALASAILNFAAVVAVVTESYIAEAATAVVEEGTRRSAWEISSRGLRAPLRRDIGWGRFAG